MMKSFYNAEFKMSSANTWQPLFLSEFRIKRGKLSRGSVYLNGTRLEFSLAFSSLCNKYQMIYYNYVTIEVVQFELNNATDDS